MMTFKILPVALLAILLMSYGCEPAPDAKQLPSLDVMPYPSKVTLASGHFVVNETFSVFSDIDDEFITSAVDRFIERASLQTGLTLATAAAPNPESAALVITLEASHTEKHSASSDDPRSVSLSSSDSSPWHQQENYALEITPDRIELSAESNVGIVRGLETLLQLLGTPVKNKSSEPAAAITLPALTINDSPRFPWRGLMLDSVRHFFSVNTIKRQLDGMAAAKLNVFHWHLTDDQGWRLESKLFPKLHQQASGGLYYSHDDVREIVAYAKARGIEVLPEIDMPGHATAIGVAYPELMTSPGPYVVEERWGVHTPLLNPANEAVYAFADKIFSEVASLFPFAYVHIGGDEVNPRDWANNSDIREFMQQQNLDSAPALQAYFNQRIAALLATHGRKMIGWDEVLHPSLPNDVIIQSWQGPDALGEAVAQDHPALLSTGFYLDQPQPAAYHYRNSIVPQPLQVDTDIDDGETWQTWTFEMPRKRGNSVRGSFTIITDEKGGLRGFIDFANQSRRDIQNLHTQRDLLQFSVDTWMGKMQPRLRLHQGKLAGEVIVANAKYLATGKQIAGSDHENNVFPSGKAPITIDDANMHLVLGGEAAVWSELIDENTIDLRIWPRAFVVAERLWSPKTVQDEDFMYERLQAVSSWSELSVDLRHKSQPVEIMKNLIKSYRIESLQILAQAVEPAQYYHRHHEKFTHETYSRRDPLDRFVDALPAESREVRTLSQNIDAWLANRGNAAAKAAIENQLTAWAANQHPMLLLVTNHHEIASLEKIVHDVRKVATVGLKLVSHLELGQPLTAEEYKQARRQLLQAQEIQHEMIVAAAYPVEKLLMAIDKMEKTP